MIIAAVTNGNRWAALAGALLVFVLAAANTASQNLPQNHPQNHPQDKAASAARAKELLRRARVAAGIESNSGVVQTLSFSAKSQRFLKYVSVQSPTKVEEKERTLGGKIEG